MSNKPSFAERRERLAEIATYLVSVATALPDCIADLEFEVAQMSAAEQRFAERRRGASKRERA